MAAHAAEQLAGASLRQITGQLLVVGFDGTALPGALARALGDEERGGVIVFRRNLPDLQTLCRLTAAVHEARAPQAPPPFIALDEEGGRVSRVPAPLPRLPAMRELAEQMTPAQVEALARALGELLGELGFTLNFAPVLDTDSNPANPIIGDRAFSRDPARVAAYGRAVIQGLTAAGVIACGKHFPGHGDTAQDSHLDLPFVEQPEARLRSVELAPFAELAREVPTLMTAHVVYPAWDTLPATLSQRISSELLRGELGFQGALFSDDLEMRALADRMPIEESAVRAVRAGCDALLVCHELTLAERAHAALMCEAERDPAFEARCREACVRTRAARSLATLRVPSEAGSRAAAERLRALLAAEH
jgi:beta-N-acetylhexosaminidase